MAKNRVQLVLDDAKKTEWIESFDEKGRFPSNDVPCSTCNEGVTMFGSNLKNRVTKFGSAKKLLDEFVCRDCKGKIKRGEVAAPVTSKVEDEVIEEEVTEEDVNDVVCVEEADEVVTEEEGEPYVICEEEDSEVEVEVEQGDDTEEEETEGEECGEDCGCEEEEGEEASASREELKERYKAFYSLKK